MKYSFLLFCLFAGVIIYASIKYPHGIVGTTKLNGEGCTCHNAESDPLVKVWIEGPETLIASQSAIYKLYLTGGPKVKGGFNIASLLGTLTAIDSFSKKIDVELTHAFPKQFNSLDTISWDFKYTAPSTMGSDTIYSVAMSANGDEIPTDDDKWNFGKNFAVTFVRPSNLSNERLAFTEFELEQNYPNPFNPSTRIRFQLANNSNVSLTVYDMIGNKVAALINEYKPAGSYEIEFKSTFFSPQLVSGVYYYRLEAGSFNQTKKMVLIR